MAWTAAQKAKLTELWATEMTAREIAAEIGGDLTKNAIIGQSNRMNLPMRRIKAGRPIQKDKPPPVRAKKKAPIQRWKPRPEIAPAIVPDLCGPPGGVFMAELRSHHCRAVLGYERLPNGRELEAKYCGGLREPGKAWCGHHRARYTQPARSR